MKHARSSFTACLRNVHYPFAFLLFAFLLTPHLLAAQVSPLLDWAVAMKGTGSAYGRNMTMDKDGNLYIVGDFWNTVDFDPGAGTFELTAGGGYDAFVAKLDNNGNFVWARSMPGSRYNFGYGVAVDGDGNVYTTGWFDGTVDFDPGAGTANVAANNGSGYYDIYIQKLDANGNFVWVKTMGSGGSDEGFSIAIDADGDVYITGSYAYTVDFDPGPGVFNLSSPDFDAVFIAKYSPEGNLIWAKSIDGQYDQEAFAVAVDLSGNVFATGNFYAGAVDFDPGPGVFTLTPDGTDIFIVKLDTDGNFAWASSMGGIYSDFGEGITTDAAGNVYTTGNFNATVDFDPGPGTFNLTSTNASDAFISKLDADGNFVWAKNIDGKGATNDKGTNLAVDASGNVYATGAFYGTADFDPGAGVYNLTPKGGTDVYILKLTKDGDFVWATSEGGNFDEGLGIAVDAANKVYIAGFYEGTVDFDPSPCVYNLTTSSIIPAVFIQKLSQGTPVPGPTITSFTPVSGQVGTEVVITGTHYSIVPAENVVKFNNNKTAIVTESTSTSLTTTVPTGTVTGKISVTTNCITTTSTDDFTIVAAGTPAITSFTPVSGPVGTTVTITGINFSPTPASNTIKFNNITATATASTATSITTKVPASATTGKITVTVAGKTGTSATNFTVTAANTITINTQPTSSAVCSGAGATFTTAATGTSNIVYQWQYATTSKGTYSNLANDSHYTGATTGELSVNTSDNFGAGFYRCMMNGDLAAVDFTAIVQLTVNALPASPGVQGDSDCPPATLTLTATGAGNGSYRWYTAATGGAPLNSANDGTFTTPALTATTTYYASVFNGICESTRIAVEARLENCNPPVIVHETISTPVGGKIVLDLKPLITTENLDLSSLRITSMPSSGALATIDQKGILTIDYAGRKFAGSENITIEACDLNGRCSQEDLSIEVAADVLVYNAVSPEGKNPFFRLEYIDIMDETKKNTVTIYNRWGDEVFSISDYNNNTRVFNGLSSKGDKLPSGTYYFKVSFASGRKGMAGYLELRY